MRPNETQSNGALIRLSQPKNNSRGPVTYQFSAEGNSAAAASHNGSYSIPGAVRLPAQQWRKVTGRAIVSLEPPAEKLEPGAPCVLWSRIELHSDLRDRVALHVAND